MRSETEKVELPFEPMALPYLPLHSSPQPCWLWDFQVHSHQEGTAGSQTFLPKLECCVWKLSALFQFWEEIFPAFPILHFKPEHCKSWDVLKSSWGAPVWFTHPMQTVFSFFLPVTCSKGCVVWSQVKLGQVMVNLQNRNHPWCSFYRMVVTHALQGMKVSQW